MMSNKTMKAQIINEVGAPDVFTLQTLHCPELKPGHVIIRVHATSVNPIDTKIRSGQVKGIIPDFPAILHSDIAGVIEVVADDVTEFKVGDSVFGCAGGIKGTEGGALAEYMLADARLIAHKPQALDMREAAALPLVSITAWMGLFDKLNLKKNQKILIHGGAGGVGHIAIQLAVAVGAEVYTTVSNKDDAAIVMKLGAKDFINYKDESVEKYRERLTNGEGFPLIFDSVGGPNLKKSFAACALMGKIATTIARLELDISPLHNLGADLDCVMMLIPLIHHKHRERYAEILTEMAGLVDAGKIRPILDPNHFTLENVADAHALLESGQAQGKVVISVV